MKISVIKLGSRISFNANDTSGANGEARSICKMLKMGGAEVHIYTKILSRDNLVNDYIWHDILEDAYNSTTSDALVVLNGQINFFGGAEDPAQLLNYAIITGFKGPVFYIYCDPELTLKQVWPSVAKKPWGNKWARTDLDIVRDDIVYLSQPFDVELVRQNLNKNEIVPSKIIHFPFEKFPCLNTPLPINEKPEIDLIYGGTMRGGKRVKKMIKFYFGHPDDLTVEMFGKIEQEDFDKCAEKNKAVSLTGRSPRFAPSVQYDKMLPKMNTAMAHCVVGDPYYEKINDIPQRLWESVNSNVVTFIDTDMDKMRRVWANDKMLGDFLYVQDRQELTEKLQLLKSDNSLRKQILSDQFKALDFKPVKYCQSFVSLIEKSRK